MNKVIAFIRHEIHEAFPSFVFFLAIFQLGHVTKALLLAEVQVTAGSTAVAVVGALLVAKAILVADAVPLTNLFARRPLAWSIAWKTLIYGLITLAFHYAEELIPLAHRYGGLAAGQERLLEEFSWPHFWVVQLWMVFSLLLYCTGRELLRALGSDGFLKMLFGRPAPAR